MKRSKRVHTMVSIVVIVVLVGIVGVLWYLNSVESSVKRTDVPVIADAEAEVTDFASCVAAGNPVMESYPEQCSANGQTYTNPDQSADPTLDWKEFVSEEGKFSLKYPADWVQAPNLDQCNPGLLLLGANADSVGRCATENGGQISFYSYEDDGHDRSLSADGYTDTTEEPATADGVNGVRYFGHSPGPSPESGFGHKEGTEVVRYVFKRDGQIFVAEYTALDTFPDVLSDFELVVTKTVRFND